jgi:hypothetical protein
MEKSLEMSSRLLQTFAGLDELMADVSALREAVRIAEATKIRRGVKPRIIPRRPALEARA